MRLIAFFVAIIVLFSLSDSSMAQELRAAAPTKPLTWPGKVAASSDLAAPPPRLRAVTTSNGRVQLVSPAETD